MSQIDKLINRLMQQPKDFSYSEPRKVMLNFGYIEDNKGKSSGSRVAFYHSEREDILRLHKPHPSEILKAYQIKQAIEFLKGTGDI